MPPDAPSPPLWDRSRLRWVNSLGFALCAGFAVWLLIAVFGVLSPGRDRRVLEVPLIYLGVAGAALVVWLSLFATLLIRHFARGANFEEYGPRATLYFWSLSGALFFVLSALIFWRFDAPEFPRIPAFATDFAWFFTPIGVLVFGTLVYVNADLPSRHQEDDFDHGDLAFESHHHGDTP